MTSLHAAARACLPRGLSIFKEHGGRLPDSGRASARSPASQALHAAWLVVKEAIKIGYRHAARERGRVGGGKLVVLDATLARRGVAGS